MSWFAGPPNANQANQGQFPQQPQQQQQQPSYNQQQQQWINQQTTAQPHQQPPLAANYQSAGYQQQPQLPTGQNSNWNGGGNYYKPTDLNQNYSQAAVGSGQSMAAGQQQTTNDGWGDWGDDWSGGGGGGATNDIPNNNHLSNPTPPMDNYHQQQQQLPPPPQSFNEHQQYYGQQHHHQQPQQPPTMYSNTTTANYPAPPPMVAPTGYDANLNAVQGNQENQSNMIADSFNNTDSWNWGNVDSNANQVELIRKPAVFNKMSTNAVQKIQKEPDNRNYNTNQPDDMKSQNYGALHPPPPIGNTGMIPAVVPAEPQQQFNQQTIPGDDLDPLDVALMQMNVQSDGNAATGASIPAQHQGVFQPIHDSAANFFQQQPAPGGITLPNAVPSEKQPEQPPSMDYGIENQEVVTESIPKPYTTPFNPPETVSIAQNHSIPPPQTFPNQPSTTPPVMAQPPPQPSVSAPPPMMPPPASNPMSLAKDSRPPSAGNPFKRSGAPVHRNLAFTAPVITTPSQPAVAMVPPPVQPQVEPQVYQAPPPAAPHNNDDRNEYLQTDQLSEESLSNPASNEPIVPETVDNLPPPGLSRLVLGETEVQQFPGNLSGAPSSLPPPQGIANLTAVPPPGLDRMIPGTDLEGGSDMGLQREADGQDDDVSVGNYPAPQLNNDAFSGRSEQQGEGAANLSDRNLYRVPGESRQHMSMGPPPSRVVTGDENALPFVQAPPALSDPSIGASSAALNQPNVAPSIEESRDLQPVDGENSDDNDNVRFNRQRGELIERDGPIEGENARDEIISSGGAMGSVATMSEVEDISAVAADGASMAGGSVVAGSQPPPPPMSSRKETSTGEDSEKDRRSYYKGKGGDASRRNEDTGSLRRKPKTSERYDSESETSDRRESSTRKNYDRSYATDRRDRDRDDRDGRRRRGGGDDSRQQRGGDRSDRRQGDRGERRGDEDYDLRYGRDERRSKRQYDVDREEQPRRRDRNEREGDAKRAEKERQYRKDRDRERDRDDRRDYRDDRRYGGRDKDRRYEYDEERYNRSGSRNTDRSRDPRYAGSGYYGQNYGYDHYAYYTQQQQQQMQYYENLRRTNPQAYAEWYRKYYMQMQGGGAVPGGGAAAGVGAAVGPGDIPTDGRESVHSGRSSTNDKDRYSRMTGSYYHQPYGDYQRHLTGGGQGAIGIDHSMMDSSYGGIGGTMSSLNHSYNYSQYTTQRPGQSQYPLQSSIYAQSELSDSRQLEKDGHSLSQRMTPFKFTNEHSQVAVVNGLMVCIKPKYTQSGVVNLVKIINVGSMTNDNDTDKRLLAVYPGPLVRGVTHKKTVIEFCEERLKAGPFSQPLATRENSLLRSHANSMTSLCSVTQNSNQQLSSQSAGQNQQFKASYNLMWNLLILLLRQNGTVVGTDISELLIKNASEFPTTNSNLVIVENVAAEQGKVSLSATTSAAVNRPDGGDASLSDINSDESGNEVIDENILSKSSNLTEDQITEKFRNYLLYGNVTEALDWATENNLWGHALFLASKLDRRSHANVMMKFANKLALNDPLQTLYQLMSLRMPSFVTSVVDKKWGDWRPHLAMILANTSQKPELDRKAITTLGDSLFHIGDIYGAHFCYLMAQVGFGKYERWTAETAATAPKLVLLGASLAKAFREFATTEAIMMTEIYEYAVTLNDENYSITEFQPYKFTLATRLLDYGHQLKAFLYMEQLAKHIKRDPQRFEWTLINNVCNFADRLRYYDPVQEKTAGVDNQIDSQDSEGDNQKWIQELKEVQNHLQSHPVGVPYNGDQQLQTDYGRGSIDREFSEINQQFNQLNLQYQNYEPQPNPTQNDYYGQRQQQQPEVDSVQQHPPQSQYLQPDYNQTETVTDAVNHQESHQAPETNPYDPYGYQQQPPQDQYQSQSLPPQGNFYNPAAYDSGSYSQPQSMGGEPQPDGGYDYYGQQQQQSTPEADYEPPRPQISMPSSMSHRPGFYDDDEGKRSSNAAGQSQAAEKSSGKGDKDKGLPSSGGKGGEQQSSGWFGGIFGKFGKPKNQMILPDDKNPTIVWDPDKKRWINTDEGETEAEAFKPPPKMSEMGLPQQQPPMGPPQPPQQQQPPQMQGMPPSNNFMNAPAPVPIPSPMMMNVGGPQGEPQAEEASAVDGGANKPTNNLQSNQFKLQRNRTLKKSYVDVFNPSGAPMKPVENFLAPSQVPSIPQGGYFIPGAPMGGQ